MSSVYDIQGRNCLFQLLIGDDYMDVVCAKTFSINVTTEMKETTASQSGFWTEKRPRKLSYVINFNGAVQVIAESDKPTVKSMLINQIQFLPFNYRLLYYDNSDNLMGITGQVYVGNTVIDANPINLLNGTTELQGNGPIEVIDALPEMANINIASTGDGSITALFQFKLINTDGEIIFDSGRLPEASGGNLSHPANATGQVLKGSYYIYWQATTDSDLNNFSTTAPPTLSTDFIDGTQNENTYPSQLYDFTADRNVVFALGIPAPPPSCVAPSIVGSPAMPDAVVGEVYTFSFTVNGTTPFSISNVTKPAWLDISVSGTIVTMTGTPDTGDVGTGIVVSFDINNSCGTDSFSDTIIVSSNPDLIIINYSFTQNTGGFGVFRIFKNGSPAIAPLSATGSGSINAVPGDVMQVTVTQVGSTKHIVVNDSVSGDIYDVTNGNTTNTFSWTAVLGSDYTITATIS